MPSAVAAARWHAGDTTAATWPRGGPSMVKTAVGTGDQPPDPPYDGDAHAQATLNALRRIHRNRRQLTQAEAEAIVREEANQRGIKVPGHVVRGIARHARR